jgi:hypothetical protein
MITTGTDANGIVLWGVEKISFIGPGAGNPSMNILLFPAQSVPGLKKNLRADDFRFFLIAQFY